MIMATFKVILSKDHELYQHLRACEDTRYKELIDQYRHYQRIWFGEESLMRPKDSITRLVQVVVLDEYQKLLSKLMKQSRVNKSTLEDHSQQMYKDAVRLLHDYPETSLQDETTFTQALNELSNYPEVIKFEYVEKAFVSSADEELVEIKLSRKKFKSNFSEVRDSVLKAVKSAKKIRALLEEFVELATKFLKITEAKDPLAFAKAFETPITAISTTLISHQAFKSDYANAYLALADRASDEFFIQPSKLQEFKDAYASYLQTSGIANRKKLDVDKLESEIQAFLSQFVSIQHSGTLLRDTLEKIASEYDKNTSETIRVECYSDYSESRPQFSAFSSEFLNTSSFWGSNAKSWNVLIDDGFRICSKVTFEATNDEFRVTYQPHHIGHEYSEQIGCAIYKGEKIYHHDEFDECWRITLEELGISEEQSEEDLKDPYLSYQINLKTNDVFAEMKQLKSISDVSIADLGIDGYVETLVIKL
jgi:hypothetical protein